MSAISYYLNRASDYLYDVASTLFELGARIRTVYLLGTYLTPRLWDVASFIKSVVSMMRQGTNHFDSFYHEIIESVNRFSGLDNLRYWANALIDFISNPYPLITNIVRGAFNYLDWMYHNAYDFIFPHVVRLLDTYFPQWRDIRSFVIARISEQFQDFNTLRYNPVQWVIDRLRAYSYNVGRFLQDPDGYLIERVGLLFPSLREFLQDPSTYIINKLSDRLENFVDRNMARIIKIAENIISAIF